MYGYLCFFFFFFSSRRRHTRFDCDWSSDVCSSDLGALLPGLGHGQLDLRTGPDLVESLDDDPLARPQPLLDDPERADSLAELNPSHVHRLVGADDGDLMEPLQVLDGSLRDKERVLPEVDYGAYLHELAGPQKLAGVREHSSAVDGAGRPPDLAAEDLGRPPVHGP